MRLFLLNRAVVFDNKNIVKRTRTNANIVNKELRLLVSIGFIKKLSTGCIFNPSFKYRTEIEGLLINSDTFDKEAIANIFKKVGRVKLLIVSGIFIKNKNSRVDLLLVGDKLRRSKIEEGIRKLEAEIGTELVYAVFDTKDFNYRLNMYDKLVRDILDFEHEVILQAKELSTQNLQKS